jgi:hypothetical protein
MLYILDNHFSEQIVPVSLNSGDNPMSDHTPVSGPQAMTPSEAFVETLAANGVTDMFGIMGSAFMDAMDIFAAMPACRAATAW